MRLAFFHNLPTGDAKRVAFEQIQMLSRKHEIDVYQINAVKDVFSIKRPKNKTFTYKFKTKRKTGVIGGLEDDFRNFVLLKKLHKKIANDIDSRGYDIVIAHPDKFTQAPFILQFLKTKNVYYCHELLRVAYEDRFKLKGLSLLKKIYAAQTRKLRKKIDFENANAADFIVCNSKYTAKNVRAAYKRTATVLYPGIDSKVFRPITLDKNYDILFIGEKNQFDGYDVLQKIEKILGDVEVRTLSKSENKEWRRDKFLAREYNFSKVVLTLSKNEPFGLIPLEAASCGIPVVAINDGGYKETVVDSKSGFLVKGEVDEVADRIGRLLESEELRQKMGDFARKLVVKSWDWSVTIREFEDVLKRMVAK